MDSAPVQPGSEASMAFFSYHLMVTGKTVPVERAFAYPVKDLSILVTQPGLTLQSEQVLSQGVQQFQDQQFELFAASNLAPDEPLVLLFEPVEGAESMPATPGSSSSTGQSMPEMPVPGNQSLLRVLGYVLAGLAVIGVVVYLVAAKPLAAASAPARKLTSDPKARRLLAELADLEDAFEAGQMDEATYERRRAETYEALKSL